MYLICPGCLVIGGQKFTALDPGMIEDKFNLIHPLFFIIAFEYLQAYRIELAISGNIHLGHLQGHRMSSADCGQQWDTIKDVLKSNRIS